MAETDIRPNIRIEISNNLVEPESMDVDEENKASGREEGEIWEETAAPQAAVKTASKPGNRVSRKCVSKYCSAQILQIHQDFDYRVIDKTCRA